jgi:hypothetical protein
MPRNGGYETKVVGGLLILFALILFFVRLGFSKRLSWTTTSYSGKGLLQPTPWLFLITGSNTWLCMKGLISRLFGLAKIEIYCWWQCKRS